MQQKNCDIIMGYACNNRCKHCIRGGKDRKNNLSIDRISTFLKGAKERMVTRIILQGGEPTIRNDLLDIIDMIKKMDFPEIQIQSNGRMFSYNKFANDVAKKNITVFCLSVHGHNAKIHDEFTQVEGSFNQTIAGIKNLIAMKQNIKILIIISITNYMYLKEIADLLIDIGVRHFQIGVMNPEGSADIDFNDVVPRFNAIKEPLHRMLKTLQDNKTSFMTQDIPKCFMQGFENYVIEDTLPDAEKLFPEEDILDHELYRKAKKSKGSQCISCIYSDSCEGIYDNYSKRFGFDELIPKISNIK